MNAKNASPYLCFLQFYLSLDEIRHFSLIWHNYEVTVAWRWLHINFKHSHSYYSLTFLNECKKQHIHIFCFSSTYKHTKYVIFHQFSHHYDVTLAWIWRHINFKLSHSYCRLLFLNECNQKHLQIFCFSYPYNYTKYVIFHQFYVIMTSFLRED